MTLPKPREVREYTVIIERDGDGYSAHFPDLPGCFTQGDTIEEVRANAREALDLYVQVLRKKGEPIPEPSTVIEKVALRAS
jgi:predicted RNase H-like HicB family nuclease